MPFLNFQILEDGKPDRLNPPLFRSSGSTHTHTHTHLTQETHWIQKQECALNLLTK